VKGNDQLLQKLDELLAEELTAINQYVVHAEMCDNWGYDRLHESVEGRARQEMKHAEKLIARMIFLEGQPTVSRLKDIHIGADVEQQLKSDLASEMNAVRLYNEAIKLAYDVGDAATRELLEDILEDEDAHVDWIEEQLDQIQQMGIGLYLSTQTKE
jgi:bacterioferritin